MFADRTMPQSSSDCSSRYSVSVGLRVCRFPELPPGITRLSEMRGLSWTRLNVWHGRCVVVVGRH